MSHEDLKQQHDTVNNMAKQIATMITYWPYMVAGWSIVLFIGGIAIGGYKYDANIVKQPQFRKEVNRLDGKIDRDSTRHATHLGFVTERIVNGKLVFMPVK